MQYGPFVRRTSELAGISDQNASIAVQSVMRTLAEQLSEKESHDLWSQLPSEFEPARRGVSGHELGYSSDQFIEQVATLEGVPVGEAGEHVRATFTCLQEAVSEGELAGVLNEMVRDAGYLELWAPPREPVSPPVPGLTRDEFVGRVESLSGLPREESLSLIDATLLTLADRVSAGEARQLAAHLPSELQLPITSASSPAEPFDLREFMRRIAVRSGRGSHDVDPRPVLRALAETVPHQELQDALSQLPEEITALFRQAPV